MTSQLTKEMIQAGQAWETDEIVRANRSERRAWIFAGVSMACAIAACIAIAGLTPLKSVEPFVVRVDKNTGFTDIVTRLDQNVSTADESLDKYWLSRYVDCRESYSNAMALPNYQCVSLMSTKQVGARYFEQINPDNPKSPVNVYKKDGTVEVGVYAVPFLGNNVAQVHFTRTERMNGAPSGVETRWIATVTYRYVASSMKEKDRLINPIGFQVIDYRVAPETVKAGG